MNDCVLEDGFGQRPSVSYVRVGFFPKQLCCRGYGGCGKWPAVAPALPRPSRPPRFRPTLHHFCPPRLNNEQHSNENATAGR